MFVGPRKGPCPGAGERTLSAGVGEGRCWSVLAKALLGGGGRHCRWESVKVGVGRSPQRRCSGAGGPAEAEAAALEAALYEALDRLEPEAEG